MKENPKVSVVMSVYNGERYLAAAIESILSQTFRNFEFIIINDGSTDKSRDIIHSFKDPRIVLVNQENRGLASSLNKGIEMSRGDYIARMDADDISLPDRLSKQVDFMMHHPEIGICGTWVRTVGDQCGDEWCYPTESNVIKCRLLFDSVLAHPSVVFRRSVFEVYQLKYNEHYRQVQDYDLWVRASKFVLLANIPEVLLLYRIHDRKMWKLFPESAKKNALNVWQEQIEALGLKPLQEELELHRSISLWQFKASKEYVDQSEKWLLKLKLANARAGIYPSQEFSQVLGEKWIAICEGATKLGLWTWFAFQKSEIARGVDLTFKRRVCFILNIIFGKNLLQHTSFIVHKLTKNGS